MNQYTTKEDVLKLGIIDPEFEEVSQPTNPDLTNLSHKIYRS